MLGVYLGRGQIAHIEKKIVHRLPDFAAMRGGVYTPIYRDSRAPATRRLQARRTLAVFPSD